MINPTAIVNKKTLTIAGYFVAIALLLGLAYWVYTEIKAWAKRPSKAPPIDGPGNPEFDGDGSGSSGGYNKSVSNDELFAVAKTLRNALYGSVLTLSSTKNEAAEAAANLYDNDLIRLHNYWNKEYFKEHNETLHDALVNETNVPFAVVGTSNYYQQLIDRLKQLNLV